MAEKGEWVAVADVSLYKKEELRKKMGRGGDEGRTGEGERGREKEGESGRRGDVALILEAYLNWGEECLQTPVWRFCLCHF